MISRVKPDCSGLPDCDPPDLFMAFAAGGGASLFFFGTDMVFYRSMGESFKDPFVKTVPDLIPLAIGIIIASAIFTAIYVYFARRPQSSHINQEIRSRTSKGAIYGFAMGLFLFAPATIIDFAVLENVNLTNHIIAAGFHIVQFVVAGILIAHILGKPARP